MADYISQLGGEGIEVLRQQRDFILAVGIQATGQIAFAAGNIGHGLHRLLQGAHDAAALIELGDEPPDATARPPVALRQPGHTPAIASRRFRD